MRVNLDQYAQNQGLLAPEWKGTVFLRAKQGRNRSRMEEDSDFASEEPRETSGASKYSQKIILGRKNASQLAKEDMKRKSLRVKVIAPALGKAKEMLG